MNLTEQNIESKAKFFANHLLKQAQKHEKEITFDLQKIALQVFAEIVGIEHKFKTEESLTQKLTSKVKADITNFLIEGLTENEAIEKSINLRAKQNNDTLRYTFLFSNEKYVFAFKQTLNFLVRQNYKIPEKRVWNAWKNVGTVFDNGYRGINITIVSSQHQKFELQFHTEESFDLKRKTHKLYKQIKLNTISSLTKEKIKTELVEMAQEIQTPNGVKKL